MLTASFMQHRKLSLIPIAGRTVACALGLSCVFLYGCGGGDGPSSPNPTPVATSLHFDAQPSRTEATGAISPAPRVVIRDQFGNVLTSATGIVSVALGANSAGGALLGTTTVNAVAGVATFSDLRLDRPGSGYTLVASAAGLTSATSAAFDVSRTFTTISAGVGHSCATTPVTTYCWGNNDSGQLGDGSAEIRTAPVPVALPPGVSFTAVSAGSHHTCGLTAAGAIYCWGLNDRGQLGDGTTAGKLVPTLVATPQGVSFSSVSSGSFHTCAVTSAGTAYCWGDNGYGQVGNGSINTYEPVAVPVAAPAGVTFASVTAGFGDLTCGVTTTGAAYCWGRLGYDDRGQPWPGATPTVVELPAGVTFATVVTGAAHACGLTASGAAYCWGNNDNGRLGDGTITYRPRPVLAAAPAGVTFASIMAGGHHTCGRTSGGTAYCWGRNDFGQLGNGAAPGNSTTPGPVSAPEGVSFAVLSAGWWHTCGLTAAGAAYCWGYNLRGQLGNGSMFGSSPVPVRVVE